MCPLVMVWAHLALISLGAGTQALALSSSLGLCPWICLTPLFQSGRSLSQSGAPPGDDN